MADFCKQCSLKIFGEDFGELANLLTEEEEKDGKFIVCLCEECGYAIVDKSGACHSSLCSEKHGEQK
jgi:hypothetical protein